MIKLIAALTGVVLLISGAALGAAAVQQPFFDFLQLSVAESTSLQTLDQPDCEALPAPKVNWSGCDKSASELHGSDASLAEAALTGANLSSSYLDGVDLSGSDIDGLDLSSSLLFLVNFSGATGIPTGTGARFFIYTCPGGSAVANFSGDVSQACSWLAADGSAPAPEATPEATPADTQEDPQDAAPTAAATATISSTATAAPVGEEDSEAQPTETPEPPIEEQGLLNINGRLLNNSGIGVYGAVVGLSTGETAKTDGEGFFTFNDLLPGTYTISPPPPGALVYDPPGRTVTIPPSAADQRFTGTAAIAEPYP